MYKHLGLPMYIKGDKFYFGLTWRNSSRAIKLY
jgi:hypothetical protein